MYLIDTNVISEARKGDRANVGVRRFFAEAIRQRTPLFLSVVTIGELRRGAELIRHRGDKRQASRLKNWLTGMLDDYADHILAIDSDIATVWGYLRVPHPENALCSALNMARTAGVGYLRVPHPENALDKLIAATALIHDLTVVTRNFRHFSLPGLNALDPFEG